MLPGDERIVAGNAKEFVHELRVGSWMDSDCTDEQYMHKFCRTLCGAVGCADCHRYAREVPCRFDSDRICQRNVTDGFLYYYTIPVFLSWEDGDFYMDKY